MTSLEEYRSDISKDVQKDVKRLIEYEARIAELEVELTTMKKERDLLRVSLLPYRIDRLPLDQTIARINRLPNELLYIIFECTLLGKHHHIRTLLLVCRQWYELVMGSPKLWARIDIPNAIRLFDLVAKKSLAPYIEACYRNSKQAPMEVCLRLDEFPNRAAYIREELRACAELIFRDRETHWLPRSFDEIVDQIDDLDTDYPCTSYGTHFDCVLLPLVGTNGDNLQRWDSLTISFPEDYEDSENTIFSHIWTTVRQVVPYLKEFHAKCGRGWPSQDEWHEDVPIFSSVTSFSIPQPACPTFYQLSPSLLQHLAIHVEEDYSNLLKISQFSELRSLTLDLGGLYRVMDPPALTIRLPLLRKLELINYRGSNLENVIFDAPLLESICIEVVNILTTLPQVSSAGITSITLSYGNQIASEQFLRSLSEIARLSHTLNIRISERYTDRTVDSIAKCRAEGRLQLLEHLYICDRNSGVFRTAEIPPLKIKSD